MRRSPACGRRGLLLGAIAALGIVKGARADTTPSPGDSGTAAAAADQTPKPTGPPPNLEELSPDTVVAILGKKARDASGHDMGLVVDVLVGRYGFPRAAVIDFGGFLGVGSRKIAIDWTLLGFKLDDADAPIVLALDRSLIQAAPEYKPAATQPTQVVGPPQAPSGSGAPNGK
jgi:hypothetical protein